MPHTWAEATPYAWLSSGGGLRSVLLAGTGDPLLDDARRYARALRDHGRHVRLVEIPPAGDQTLVSPRTEEGRTVVAEVVAAAGRPG